MESFFEKLKSIKKEIKLDPNKKTEIKRNLLRFVEADLSVRGVELARHDTQRSKSKFFNPMPVFASLVLIVLVGGGTTLAAEGSLPGDFLYPVKVDVNEKVVSSFHFSAEAKTEWEIRQAERRLEEAAKLESQSKFSNENKVEIEQKFSDHADRVELRIEDLESRGKISAAVDLASKFETSLRAHEQILTKLDNRVGASSPSENKIEIEKEHGSLKVKVKSTLGDIVNVRTKLEDKVHENSDNQSASVEIKNETKLKAEAKLNDVSRSIDSLRKYLENKKDKLSAETRVQAEAQIAEAEKLVLEAKIKLEAEGYGEAYNLGNEALRVIKQTQVLIEAQSEFGFEIEIENENHQRSGDDNSKNSKSDEDENEDYEEKIKIETDLDLRL